MPNDVILYLLAEVIRRYGDRPTREQWTAYLGYNALMAFHHRVNQLNIPFSTAYGTSSPDMNSVHKVAVAYDPE